MFPAHASEAAPPAAPASMAAAPEVMSAANAAAAAQARFQAAAAAAAAIAPEPAAAAAAGANASSSRALHAFNLMATGVMTQDDALLRGVSSEDAFAARVQNIAASQPASARPDDASIARLVDELLPLVRRLNALPGGDTASASSSNNNPHSSSSSSSTYSGSAAPGAEAPAQEAARPTMAQVVATATVRLLCASRLVCKKKNTRHVHDTRLKRERERERERGLNVEQRRVPHSRRHFRLSFHSIYSRAALSFLFALLPTTTFSFFPPAGEKKKNCFPIRLIRELLCTHPHLHRTLRTGWRRNGAAGSRARSWG